MELKEGANEKLSETLLYYHQVVCQECTLPSHWALLEHQNGASSSHPLMLLVVFVPMRGSLVGRCLFLCFVLVCCATDPTSMLFSLQKPNEKGCWMWGHGCSSLDFY